MAHTLKGLYIFGLDDESRDRIGGFIDAHDRAAWRLGGVDAVKELDKVKA